MFGIKAIGFAGGEFCPHAGMWLRSFDFEFENGLGWGDFTPLPDRAMKFATRAEAMIFWRTQSKVRPLRPDGRPNRPMTALSVEVLAL